MHVLVTGATGFVGRALTLRLLKDGHTVTAVSRNPAGARDRLGAEVECVALGEPVAVRRALARAEGVVHLAGERIFPGRWTDERKRALVASRVGMTEQLLAWMREAGASPGAFVTASAVGYYGDRADEELFEDSAPGGGFAADLCRDWERAADGAEALGARVVKVRIGVVLGAEGGALHSMLPPFRAGLGGPIGSGRAYFPWIHLDDLVEIFARAVVDGRYAGPINAAAPQATRNAEFTKALGRALGRPAVLPVPAAALRLAFGEAAGVLLASQRVIPRRLEELGFAHRYPTLDAALEEIFDDEGVSIEPAREAPESPYLARRAPTHVLTQRTRVEAPVERVFDFFSHADNLGAITPDWMGFRIQTPRPIAMGKGATIEYTIRLGPANMPWKTVIEAWEPGERFVDVQERGPYRAWWHEHRFRAEGSATVMEDRVLFAAPLGPLGRAAGALYVAPTLRRIFAYRAKAIRHRFRTSR